MATFNYRQLDVEYLGNLCGCHGFPPTEIAGLIKVNPSRDKVSDWPTIDKPLISQENHDTSRCNSSPRVETPCNPLRNKKTHYEVIQFVSQL